ncbi:MAG: hypothetical protein CMK36_08525 [Porticoccaceae bacterium]|nr:hypothetical protein [Porticoccaceae bacterium]|tara:strand:+ start:7574 stop:7804 length:231 start_codon:yes stop_codon:yes gene_type:complete
MKNIFSSATILAILIVFSSSSYAGHCGGSHSTGAKMKPETTAAAPEKKTDESVFEAPESGSAVEEEQAEEVLTSDA